jgi:hypothetical protein
MAITYFKRYRMEVDLVGRQIPSPTLQTGYELRAWAPSLLEAHAVAKYRSFRDEIDANVFPCLGDLAGCRRLMAEISSKEGFLPGATWLAVFRDRQNQHEEYCGTIQGLWDSHGVGAVQNIGVTPSHRNRALGSALICRALEGFYRAGLNRVHLEVTADNEGAIRLYRRLGFVTVKTVFKSMDVACA